MKSMLLMTPGPTAINERVRMAGAKPMINPDLDPQFYQDYDAVCENLKQLFHTQDDVIILGGEGILGLEASCASLIEKGDKVLCLDNGIFGHGFGEFAELYGAEVTYYTVDDRATIDPTHLCEFLMLNHDFKLATLVHCETPSGIDRKSTRLNSSHH